MTTRSAIFVRGALLGCAVISGSVAAVRDPQQAATVDLAGGSKQTGHRIETRHLTVSTSTGPVANAPTRRVTLFADVTPKPKMHVYSPEQKDVIPVALTIEPGNDVRPGVTRFPTPEKYFFAPLKETQFVYSKPFRLAQDVTLAASASGGLTITGTLRYQACDDSICYVPQNVPVSWRVALKP
jgi:DsbC/DsbD-like thiol-disulfide interchange protein